MTIITVNFRALLSLPKETSIYLPVTHIFLKLPAEGSHFMDFPIVEKITFYR